MIISLIGFMGCGKSSVGRRLSELLCCPFMDLDDVIVQHTGRTIPEIFATDGEAAFRQMELETLHDLIEHNLFPEPVKVSTPLAPSHSKAAGPITDPAVAGCSQKGFIGPFSGMLATLPGVEKGQFRTPVPKTSNHKLILSSGGGTVMQEECAKLIKEKTVCIYLKASVDTLVERLEDEAAERPLLSQCHVERQQGDDTSANQLRTRIETLMAQRSEVYESTAHHIIDTDGLSIDAVARLLYKKL